MAISFHSIKLFEFRRYNQIHYWRCRIRAYFFKYFQYFSSIWIQQRGLACLLASIASLFSWAIESQAACLKKVDQNMEVFGKNWRLIIKFVQHQTLPTRFLAKLLAVLLLLLIPQLQKRVWQSPSQVQQGMAWLGCSRIGHPARTLAFF